MNWLLISTVLISFGVGCISADEPAPEYCSLHRTQQVTVRNKCIDNFINVTEFQSQYEQALIEYAGDDSAVLEFTQKYCPLRTKVMNCVPLILNVPDECRDQKTYNKDLMVYRIIDVIIQFLCENNAEALLEMMPNNGFKNIVLSESSNTCMFHMKDENSGNSQVNTSFCGALTRVADCFATELQVIDNNKLPRLLTNFNVKAREALEC